MRSFNEEGLSPKRRFVFVQNSPIKAISSSEMKSKKDLVRIQYHSKIFYCIHFATESIRPLHKLKSNQNFFWFFFFLFFFGVFLHYPFWHWIFYNSDITYTWLISGCSQFSNWFETSYDSPESWRKQAHLFVFLLYSFDEKIFF